jgi:hypothetical protein
MKKEKEGKRLSLADFKINKIKEPKELDKLMGGVAADCHASSPSADPL